MGSPVLLFECEEGVIKDVTCSLKLVDIPVVASLSVDEARRVAVESHPNLVLARARVRDDAAAGVTLARAFAGDEALKRTPVVALYTPSEKDLLEGHSELFVEEIGLPVEFPQFTQRVQRILASLEKGRESAPAAVPVSDQPPPPTDVPAPAGGNMLIAYDVQLKVLDQLRRDPRFPRASTREALQILEEITRAVCHSFDEKKFLG